MDELLQKLKKNFSEAEFQELKAAYDFSAAAHEGQKSPIHENAQIKVLVFECIVQPHYEIGSFRAQDDTVIIIVY